MNAKREIVVVPDVHGRTFWKDVVGITDCDIVFLGDYHDPYTKEEGINAYDSIKNFREIIEYAKGNKNVKLLYGNHDLGYTMGTRVCDVRHDYSNHDIVRGLFLMNNDLFSIAYDKIINGKRFLLTHAGVLKMWANDVSCFVENVSYNDLFVADSLNNMFNDGVFHKYMADRHFCRGGYCDAGSLVWADLREWGPGSKTDGVVQVVGHSMLVLNEPLVLAEKYGACFMDVKTCSYIDSDGNIRLLNNDKLVEEYKFKN